MGIHSEDMEKSFKQIERMMKEGKPCSMCHAWVGLSGLACSRGQDETSIDLSRLTAANKLAVERLNMYEEDAKLASRMTKKTGKGTAVKESD